MRKYQIEPNNGFFQAARGIVEHETAPACTISFSSLVDLTKIEAIRSQYASEGRRKPTYTAFVIKAVGIALSEYPYANRRVVRRPWLFFLGPRLQKFHHCDIAVAVEPDTPGDRLGTPSSISSEMPIKNHSKRSRNGFMHSSRERRNQ